LPIIPLTDELCKPIEISATDLPKPQQIDLAGLRTQMQTRAEKVIGRLVDVDLRALTNYPLFGWAVRPIVTNYAAGITVKKAGALIEQAVDQVREAFR
jgi:hypothetical protein